MNMTRPTKTRSKRRGRRTAKVTSGPVASAAGRLNALRRKYPRGRFKIEIVGKRFIDVIDVTSDVLAVTGSALVQRPKRREKAG